MAVAFLSVVTLGSIMMLTLTSLVTWGSIIIMVTSVTSLVTLSCRKNGSMTSQSRILYGVSRAANFCGSFEPRTSRVAMPVGTESDSGTVWEPFSKCGLVLCTTAVVLRRGAATEGNLVAGSGRKICKWRIF